jgi:DNA-binding IclR family transcriptional regulator
MRTAMPSINEDSYQAPALKKGLQVLEFLSGETEPYAVSELARALGKSRNEIYRMVLVLEQLGYLTRTDGDRYSLTRKLFDLAMRTPPQRNLLVKALPLMERLSRESFQSCHIMVASGPDIVVVARVESPDVLGFSVRVGYRRPLNQSAAGRVLFACKDEAERATWRALLSSEEDQERWGIIEREAVTIREMGFLLSPSPYVDAVTDIAVPVTAGPQGTAVAALVMPFIGGRSAKISLTQAATMTRETAQQMGRELA